MSLQQSKTFFTKLKETCRKIDSDVNELKIKSYEIPDNASELAAKGICDVQDKIKKLKNDSQVLESKLESSLSHTADFIQHFTDVTDDAEISVKNMESYLKQYGYEPLNRAAASPSEEEKENSPVKKDWQLETEDLNTTPNIIDYGITSHQYAKSLSLFSNRKPSIEDLPLPPKIELNHINKDNQKSGSTPTLDINDLIQIGEKETPPLPEIIPLLSQLPRTPKLEL